MYAKVALDQCCLTQTEALRESVRTTTIFEETALATCMLALLNRSRKVISSVCFVYAQTDSYRIP
jgi:hypothetical protein